MWYQYIKLSRFFFSQLTKYVNLLYSYFLTSKSYNLMIADIEAETRIPPLANK